MNRVYRYRIYPTAKQMIALSEMLRDHCDLYNAALQERRDAWKMCKVGVRYGDQSAQLRAIRSDGPQHARWSFTGQQQTLRRLDKAFQAFFDRIKRGDTPGYPRFKPWRRFNTVTFIDGDGGKWLETDRRVRMQGIGHVKVKIHRPTKGTVKQFSVTRSGKRWFINIICVDVPAEDRAPTGAAVGLDRGITHLVATSDGDLIANPRHLRQAEDCLARAQRDVAAKKRGSNRRRKAVARLARQHERLANTRRDYLHKVSRQLVDTYDVLVLEDLRVKNMSRSAKGTIEAPGVNVAAKAGLNKSILDAGWSALADMITYKAESAGGSVVFVNPANTSRTCNSCGHVDANSRHGEDFACTCCGYEAHADINAARNILRLGLSRHVATAA